MLDFTHTTLPKEGSTHTSEGAAAPLIVNGLRVLRATWPNGNPRSRGFTAIGSRCFDTGKVRIGIAYERPLAHEISRDAALLQAALLRSKS